MPICWLPFWKIQILRQKASTFRYTYILIISKWSAVGSVSDPYSLNPDPAENLNPDPDPDPGKFFSPTKNLLEIEEKKNFVHKTIKKN